MWLVELAGVLGSCGLIAWFGSLRHNLAKARLASREADHRHQLACMAHEKDLIEQAHRHQLELSTDREVVLASSQAAIESGKARTAEANAKAAEEERRREANMMSTRSSWR